jgi:hypothetical protein
VGIMIRDQDIIARLDQIAERDGINKAAALKQAMMNFEPTLDRGYEQPLFPRDRVTWKTWHL